MAIDMVVDVLTERGYSITAECKELIVPMRVDPETHSIINATRRIWIFEVRFHAPSIRR
jgi:adenylate kinase